MLEVHTVEGLTKTKLDILQQNLSELEISWCAMPENPPVGHNREAWDGTRVTAGLVQYANDDHFAIFNNEDAAYLYQQFIISAIGDGIPMIPTQEP